MSKVCRLVILGGFATGCGGGAVRSAAAPAEIETVDADGGRSRLEFTYATSGELEEVLERLDDQEGWRMEFWYEDGRVAEVLETAGASETTREYDYDENGRLDLITTTRPDSFDEDTSPDVTTTSIEYGRDGRIAGAYWQSSTQSEEVTVTHDDQGRVSEIESVTQGGTVRRDELRYGDDGTLRRITYYLVDSPTDYTFEYRDGVLDELSYAIGESSYHWSLRYDDEGRMEEVRSDDSTATIVYGEGSLQGLALHPSIPYGTNFDATGKTFAGLDFTIGSLPLIVGR